MHGYIDDDPMHDYRDADEPTPAAKLRAERIFGAMIGFAMGVICVLGIWSIVATSKPLTVPGKSAPPHCGCVDGRIGVTTGCDEGEPCPCGAGCKCAKKP